ncbi:MAG: hypothetical protein J5737_07220 [Bacteroidales bacterium]|nr:hypothetical protein [Bacteroidales bacterium]
MRIKSFILAAVAMISIAVSCKPDKPVIGIAVEPDAITFTADGGSQTVKVKSSDAWKVSVPESAKDWLQVNPAQGSGENDVVVTASANPGKPRSVAISFNSGIVNASLTIAQEGSQKAGDGKTLATAFSASEAHDWVMSNLSDGQISSDKFFIKGIIHKMVSSGGVEQYFASNDYGNASFYISDDGQPSDLDFECFQVNYLGGRAWKAGDTDVKVGDNVVVYGYVTNFKGNTAETTGKGDACLVQLNDAVVEPVIVTKAEPSGSGTAEDPYNVAAAINAVANLGYTNTSTYDKINNVYVRGVISAIKSVDTTDQFGNAEYSIVDEGYTAVFGVYRGYFLGGDKFTANDQIKVGDKVVVTGSICKMFGTTPQFTLGNYLVELNGQKPKEPEFVSGSVSDCVVTDDKNIVEVKDAIVAALSAKGFIITDGKSNCYVFLDKEPSVKIGDKVTVKATKTTYYGLPEFKEVTDTQVSSSNNDVPRTELKDVTAEIDSYNSADTDYLIVAGNLVKDGDYFNVEVAGASRKAQAANPHSSIKLDGLVGKRVKMTGYFNTIFEKKNLLQLVVTEVAEVSADEKYCTVAPKEQTVKASATEATVAITSNTAWVINNIQDGITVSPNEGTGDATIKIALTENTGQEAREFCFHLFSEQAGYEENVIIRQEGLADSAAHSVTASLKVADGAAFEFYEATVVALCTKGFVVSDGTSNIYVYLNAAPTVKIGDKVDFSATFVADYYGLPEYKDAKNIKVVSSGNEVLRTPVVDITANIDSYSSGSADYILVTGKLTKNGSYWNVTPEGATRYASPYYMIADINPSALENQVVRFYGYFNTINSKNNYVQVIATEFLPGDENAKYCTVNPTTIKVKADVTSASFDIKANAAWEVASDNADFVLTPSSGSADATVTITFPANEGDAAKVAHINVVCAEAGVNEVVTITQAKPSNGEASSFVLDGDAIKAAHSGKWGYDSGTKNVTATDGSVWTLFNTYANTSQVTVQMNKGKSAYVLTPELPSGKSIKQIAVVLNKKNDGTGEMGDRPMDILSADGTTTLLDNVTGQSLADGLEVPAGNTQVRIICDEKDGGAVYITSITVFFE